jgi:predicted PurR-regulated permease PerM
MSKPERFSYFFLIAVFVAVAALHLATPLLTVMFSYLILNKLHFTRSKWVAISLFLVIVATVLFGFYFASREAMIALPKVVRTSIPTILDYAERYGIDLPFDDVEDLKALAIEEARSKAAYFGRFASIATHEFVFFVIGVVVGISLFLNAEVDLGRSAHLLKDNLYTAATDQVCERFRTFFQSFETVMGAQITISAINTSLTAVFVLTNRMPYSSFVILATFAAGLLPIVGNLISNTIVVGIALTVSAKFAGAALLFLIILHKFEYFLNSKIIGTRINNPMWLTLLSFLIAERLMGIGGMILAAPVLYYIKVEASRIKAPAVGPDVTPAEVQPRDRAA